MGRNLSAFTDNDETLNRCPHDPLPKLSVHLCKLHHRGSGIQAGNSQELGERSHGGSGKMSFKFECPKCGQSISVEQTAGAINGICPSCGTAIVVRPPLEFSATAQDIRAPLLSRSFFLRIICYFVLVSTTLLGVCFAIWYGLNSYEVLTDRTSDAERQRGYRASCLAIVNPNAPIGFAVVASRIGDAFNALKDNSPSAPVSAVAKFRRFSSAVEGSLAAKMQLPDDVRPIYERFVAAVKILNQRFISLQTSDGSLLLSVLLNGGQFTAHPGTALQTEVEREITEFRVALQGLVEAQDRYRVQELLDYINQDSQK